jgi:hypothetical protein
VKKSGLADSPLFLPPQSKAEASTPLLPSPQSQKEKIEKPKREKTATTSKRDTMKPRNHETTVPRYHDTMIPLVHGVAIESVRKAVKEFGKEAATHRFTVAEKKEIADLIYTYKNMGFRTSENEITRISVNFVIEDYRENGENGVLHKIIQALND